MIHLVQKIQDLNQRKLPFILVTLTEIKGSAPQVEGAKMLVTEQGIYWGTVGGGKIEAHCIRYSQDLLMQISTGNKITPHSQTWNLQTDIGMSCGGAVTLFFDLNQTTQWHVAIFGAGHISQELCRVLQTWSCHVSVFDTRVEWLERLPSAANINKKLCENLSHEVDTLLVNTYLLSMTQGHATDLPILKAALERSSSLAMIGVIGSEIKAKKIKAELIELGLMDSVVQQLICPLGLPIGNNSPPEIAVSICAQLLAIRDGVSMTKVKTDL